MEEGDKGHAELMKRHSGLFLPPGDMNAALDTTGPKVFPRGVGPASPLDGVITRLRASDRPTTHRRLNQHHRTDLHSVARAAKKSQNLTTAHVGCV